MKRKAWRTAAVIVVIGIAAAAIGLTAASKQEASRGGIAREGSSAEQAREQARASHAGTAATLGPKVGVGTFQGVSAPVSSLPVVVAPVVTKLNERDNEHLVAAKGSSNAKDPVIQKKRGVGPLSAPIANFNGICSPFGAPC